MPASPDRLRLFRSAASWFFLAILDHYIGTYLDAQDKAGHDIGWVGQVISSLPGQIWGAFILAIAAIVYLFLPAIQSMTRSWTERREKRRSAAGAPSVTATPVEPKFFGRITRFEMVNAKELSEAEFYELSEEFKSKLSLEGLKLWYIACVQIENRGAASMATTWRFAVKRKDGSDATCTPITHRRWAPPNSWPPVTYTTFEQIQNILIGSGAFHNVYVLLTINASRDDLDMLSFSATFFDRDGNATCCRVDGGN